MSLEKFEFSMNVTQKLLKISELKLRYPFNTVKSFLCFYKSLEMFVFNGRPRETKLTITLKIF